MIKRRFSGGFLMFGKYALLPIVAITCFLLCLFPSCQDSDEKPSFFIFPDTMEVEMHPNMTISQLRVKLDWIELDPLKVTWHSNDTTIAKVDDRGYVTGCWVGMTEVTATLKDDPTCISRCVVVVTDTAYLYKYRLVLKDKGVSGYSVDRPTEFLSQKAVERRNKHNIRVDESDLPISSQYLTEIEQLGGVIVSKSKWLNTVTIQIRDLGELERYEQLPFVESIHKVWECEKSRYQFSKHRIEALRATGENMESEFDSTYYGAAWRNIHMNKGELLHEKGFKGAGMDIAVIDEGFYHIQDNLLLNTASISGIKTFLFEYSSIEDPTHGIWVSSCMATNKPGYYVGTAPEANYWLLRSEDVRSEQEVELDYWVAALEYADSVGVDVVNTSLSYYYSSVYPNPFEWDKMDGRTMLATRGANMATEKGILIVCCAGNSSTWVGTPCDSPNVLTVGAIDRNGSIASFSSNGLTVDGRIKPDVVAMGNGAMVIDVDGKWQARSGTSYSSPIMCGLAACLWQAYPTLSNKQLLEVIKQSADRYDNPELPYGYGIPDMQKAMQLSEKMVASMQKSNM